MYARINSNGALLNNEIAAIQSSTEFMDTNCVEYPNGYVKLKHAGWYVARFKVTWQKKTAAA